MSYFDDDERRMETWDQYHARLDEKVEDQINYLKSSEKVWNYINDYVADPTTELAEIFSICLKNWNNPDIAGTKIRDYVEAIVREGLAED